MSQVAHQTAAYPGFCSMKQLGVFLLPLGVMLVHCRATPSIKFTGTIYTPGWRETVRVNCFAQEHNTMSTARAQTQTAWSRDNHTNHEATTLPTKPTQGKVCHDQQKKKFIITVHARVILLIANPSSRRRLHTKVKMAKCIFGDQVKKQNFPTFHICILFWYFCEISFGRDLGTKYIVATASHSIPTTKKCVNFFCVGVPMLIKKEYND